jgi:IS30 family transposase
MKVDLMMGKDHGSALLVMTERTTLINTLAFLESNDSKVVQEKIND